LIGGGLGVGVVPGSGLAVGVSSRLPGSSVSGRSQCRVAAFDLSGLRELNVFFITVSHCAWRHVISWSLATKKRSKENAFNHATLSVHSVQFPFIGAPKARCSPERRMFEPLLLANPDIDTLRHQCSRASICALGPSRPHSAPPGPTRSAQCEQNRPNPCASGKLRRISKLSTRRPIRRRPPCPACKRS